MVQLSVIPAGLCIGVAVIHWIRPTCAVTANRYRDRSIKGALNSQRGTGYPQTSHLLIFSQYSYIETFFYNVILHLLRKA
jgi:hypothetical protein